MKKYRRILGAFLLLIFTGCFPIELDISPDGHVLIPRQEGFFSLDTQKGKLTKLYTPKEGAPVFARYSPDGKSILAVMNMEGSFSFHLVNFAEKKDREIFSASNTLYTRFSPDGRNIAISRVADGQKPPIDENMPELHLIKTSDGMGKVLAHNVSSQHRWTPDSRYIMVFQILKKDDKKRYYGNLVLINIASGEKRVLASVIGSSNVFFDLSSDGKKVLLTTFAAGPPKAELKVGDDEKAKIFEVDMAKSTVRSTGKVSEFAIWSPDSKHVLLSGGEKSGNRILEVTDTDFKNFTTVATDAAKSNTSMGDDGNIYPGWINAQTVFYLARKSVYGTAGVNLTFCTVRPDGKDKKTLQALIDQQAIQQ